MIKQLPNNLFDWEKIFTNIQQMNLVSGALRPPKFERNRHSATKAPYNFKKAKARRKMAECSRRINRRS